MVPRPLRRGALAGRARRPGRHLAVHRVVPPGGGHPPSAISIFANAPQELTRSVSLRQTLDLVRTVVDVVESRVESLAGPGDEQLLRESVLRFSREIAFAAAEVYAGAAEARGAWDARLEALVVDAVLRGEADDSMQSRASALGWGEVADVTFVVGSTPAGRGSAVPAVDELRRAVRQHGVEALADRAAVAAHRDPRRHPRGGSRRRGRRRLLRARARSCVGPTVPHLFAAGRSARAALSGLAAAAAWPDAPRVRRVRRPAARAGAGRRPARAAHPRRPRPPPARRARHAPLLQTATAYLETGGSLEATRARALRAPQHGALPARAASPTSRATTSRHPREAWTVRIALALGRLAGDRPAALDRAQRDARAVRGHRRAASRPPAQRDRLPALGGNLQSILRDFVTFGDEVLDR